MSKGVLLSPGVRATVLLTLGAVAAVSGCQVSVKGGPAASPSTTTTTSQAAIPQADLEQITGQLVREKSGGGPVVITCPGDLPIVLGADELCVLAQDGKRFDLTITITKATSPNDAKWSWEVGRQLPPNGGQSRP